MKPLEYDVMQRQSVRMRRGGGIAEEQSIKHLTGKTMREILEEYSGTLLSE